jgi:hypothetical protein
MLSAQPLQISVQVSMSDTYDAELDLLTRQLMNELLEMDVESVELERSGVLPPGAKAGDPITIGSIAVAVLPALLPKIVELCQAWAMRGQGRTVKFKGKLAGQEIEFEGNSDDLTKILLLFGPSSAQAA